MRKVRAGQLFGLLLIPPLFLRWILPLGWVGGWDGAIWDDFSSWTCPFPVGDMNQPLSGLGYGPAPFPHLLPPSSPSLMATRCINVYFETGTLSWVHGDTFSVFATEHQILPLVSSLLLIFVMELSNGDRVFYTGSTELQVPTKVVSLLQDGHVELEYH